MGGKQEAPCWCTPLVLVMVRYHSFWDISLVFLSLGLSILGALTGGGLQPRIDLRVSVETNKCHLLSFVVTLWSYRGRQSC